MLLFKDLINRLRGIRFAQENRTVLLVFVLFSLLFAAYMILVEGMGFIDAYYFLVTTATTVGYGDHSPQTDLGKLLVTVYMIVGIGLLGIFLGKVTDIMVNLSSRRKKGLVKMKGTVDLLIAGYPGHEKVQTIVQELRNDPRFKDASIVCLNNQISEKPKWMSDLKVTFVYGIASDRRDLEAANIHETCSALILANDPGSIESDDHTTSICAVIEQLNPQARTIIEKVRKDDTLFHIVNADTIVEVAPPSVLAQEILDPGAIELQNAIFSTHTPGTQFNVEYVGEACSWSDIALLILRHNAIPEGFKNPEDERFSLLPNQDDTVEKGALIKYRGTSLLPSLH